MEEEGVATCTINPHSEDTLTHNKGVRVCGFEKYERLEEGVPEGLKLCPISEHPWKGPLT